MRIGNLLERVGGGIADAMAEAQAQIKARPGDPGVRIMYAQLLCAAQEWDKAARQLEALASLSQEHALFARVYAPAVAAERLRQEVFSGAKTPPFLGEPPPWAALLAQALRLHASGRSAEAASMAAKAFEEAPASPGAMDGRPFQWLADADQRLGPILEVVASGGYYWLPFAHVRAIGIDKPQDLRDLVWIPAAIRLRTGAELGALLPARYPTAGHEADTAILLARKTVWDDKGAGVFHGRGQKILATDAEETGILDIRRIEFEP